MAPPDILREVPAELHTARLLIRVPRPGDGAAVHEAVVESLADLRAWPAALPWAMEVPTVERSEVYCREAAAAHLQRQRLAYLAFERDTGRLVVGTGLHDIDWRVPRFETGYWCRSSAQRRGYGREAVGAVVDMAFQALGARRVQVLTDARNTASRALCESLGLQLEGTHRHVRITPEGELCDHCVYARIAPA